jgi:DNA-binding transcriptional MocR family regulator
MSSRIEPLYQVIARDVVRMIDQGVYVPGDQIPSIRQMSAKWNVGYNTVTAAYRSLQETDYIVAVPQSGFFVVQKGRLPTSANFPSHYEENCHADWCNHIAQLLNEEAHDQRLVHLGKSRPTTEVKSVSVLLSKMAQMAKLKARTLGTASHRVIGSQSGLLKVVQKRLYAAGCPVDPQSSYVTRGLAEAIRISLSSIISPGAIVGVDFPCDPLVLSAISAVHCTPFPIPSDRHRRPPLAAVEQALKDNASLSCLVINPTYNNPTGSLMSRQDRSELVEFMGKRSLPIIELDYLSDLDHAGVRHPYLKSFDRWGSVTLCTGFEWSLCDEANHGFIFAGRSSNFTKLRIMDLSSYGSGFKEVAMANFIANGGYDRHLRLVRKRYAKTTALMADHLNQQMPTGSHVHVPKGGYFLWVELPADVDACCLSRVARSEGIVIAPGQIFMPTLGFSNCFRITASDWSSEIRNAIARIGELAKSKICRLNNSPCSWLKVGKLGESQ